MKLSKSVFCLLGIILSFALINAAYGKVLWMDSFDDNNIDAKYEFKDHPGEWVEEDGVLKQTNPAPGDHTYCLINGEFPEPHSVIVKIRIDDWEDDDLSRTGFGVRLDPSDGAGFAFLIHQTLNNVEFLNDHLAWKNNDTVPPFGALEVGKWYWMKAEISDNGFMGKIWSEDENEPANWLLESALDFGAVRPASGIVGLNGGSNAGTGKTLVSFDNFAVCENASECVPELLTTSVEPKSKITSTWGELKR